MTKVTKFLMIFVAVATFTLIACNKDSVENTPTSTIETLNRELANDNNFEKEAEDIAKTIKEIEGYKEKFDNWRKGENTEERIDAKTASEQIEMVCNYYLSRPGEIFEKYEFVTAVAEVGHREVKEWTGADAAKAFEAVKEQLVQSFNKVEGGDKTITMIDMGNPSFENGKFIMYIQMNVGVGKTDGITNKAGNRSGDIRWAEEPLGFILHPGCGGIANREIGISTNQTLGFFAQNLPPFSSGLPGNPKLPNSPAIISTIDHVQTKYFTGAAPLFGFNLPSGTTINTQPLFVEVLFQSPLSSQFRNSGATPPFTNLGEFKVHADPALNALPDENCFNQTKLTAYKNSNLNVGNIHRTKVNQLLGTTFMTRRNLISTYVAANAQETLNPAGLARLQEHPTYHFYARISNIIGPEFPVCCPSEI
jgi:hypothetical protein